MTPPKPDVTYVPGQVFEDSGGDMQPAQLEPFVLATLAPGEEVRAHTRSTSAVLAVTDRRVVVADPIRIALNIPFDGVRRVQFDIERNRPATLVIVPERATDEPQVLAIPPEHYLAAADALVALGHLFNPVPPSDRGGAAREAG
jgi:hypothetical protein